MNWRLGIGSVEHVLADSDGEGDGRRGVRDRVRRAGRRTGARAGGGTGRHNGSTQTALWACTLLCTRCIHVSCTNRLTRTHNRPGPGRPELAAVLVRRAGRTCPPPESMGKGESIRLWPKRDAPQREAVPQRRYSTRIQRLNPTADRTRDSGAVAGAPALSRDARARPRRRRAPASTLRLRGGSHRGADRRTDTHHSVGPPDAPSVRVARPTPSHRRVSEMTRSPM